MTAGQKLSYRITLLEQRPYLCPVCEGRGRVPTDFYARFGTTTSTHGEMCQTCRATGIVWTPIEPEQGNEGAGA